MGVRLNVAANNPVVHAGAGGGLRVLAPDALQHLANLPNLVGLNLGQDRINAAGLAALANLPLLVNLQLGPQPYQYLP